MNIKIQDMNEKILSVAFLLAVLCLYSCNEEEKQEQMLVGNLVTLNVPVDGIDEGGAESAQTRGTAQNTAITVEEELEEGLTFECVLTPDVTAKTRAGVSASPVADNAKILMIAYWSNGNLYKYETFTPANPKIHLPEGGNFKLIFYSYNSTEAPALDGIVSGAIQSGSFGGYFSPGASLRDKDEDYDKNLMWTKIEDTGEISTSTILPGIIFTHLFSQVQWTAQSTAGPITACKASLFPTLRNATIRIGELKDMAPNERNVWSGDPAGSWGRPLIDFSTSAGASATVTSGAPQTMSFIPNEEREISVELDHITVNGNVFTAKSIKFNKKLSRGIRYLLTSNIKRRCTITFESEDNTKGYVSLTGEQSVASWGEQLSCTPRAAYQHKFDGWYSSKDGFRTKLSTTAGMYTIDDDGKLTVTVNKDTEGYTYQARFAFTKVRVQWVCVPEEGGSINQLYLMFDKGGSAHSEVTNISSNYTFDGWYNDKDVKITSTSVSDTAYISNNGRRINLQNVMADAIYYAKFTENVYSLDYDYYAWDAKGKYTWPLTEDSKPNTGNFAQYSCKDCLSREEAIRMLEAGWYSDVNGPEYTNSSGVTSRHGIWVRKRDGWYTGEIDVNKSRFWRAGTATDEIRTSGKYIYFPMMGGKRDGGPYNGIASDAWWLNHGDGNDLDSHGIPTRWTENSGAAILAFYNSTFNSIENSVWLRRGFSPSYATDATNLFVGMWKEYGAMRMIMP